MFRPTFDWLIAAAAVLGAVSGFLSGREKDAAQSAGRSPVAQTEDASNAPVRTEPEAVPQPTVAPEKDLAAICRMRSEPGREAALLAFADSLDATNIEAAIHDTRSLSAEDLQQVLATLFARWAELAPQAAANGAVAMKGERAAVVDAVVEEWAARDPEALWEWAQAQPKGTVHVLGVIARQDASKAWQWAQKLDLSVLDPGRSELFEQWGRSEFFEQWGRQDGAEAFRIAQSLPGDTLRAAIESVLQGWAISNPQAALAAVQEIKDREMRTRASEQVFKKWAARDPHAAIEAWLAQPSRGSRPDCFFNMVISLADRDPQALPALLERLAPGSERDSALNWSATQLVSDDPAAAFALVQRIDDDYVRRYTFDNVVQRAYASRLNELRELANTLPTSEDREEAQKAIEKVWAESDPVAAAKAALGLEDSERRRELLQNAVANWPDPSAAWRWAQTIADESDRATALRGILSRWAKIEPQQAAAHFDQLDERFRADAASLRQWMKRDPAAASAWALKLPGNALREYVIAQVVEQRLPFGIADTAAWIETLPSGGLRDAAVVRFCSEVQRSDPPTALARALTIGTPEQRRDVIRSALSSWREDDPDGARRWIESTNAISPESKKEFLE